MNNMKQRVVEALRGFALVQAYRGMPQRVVEIRALAAELDGYAIVPKEVSPAYTMKIWHNIIFEHDVPLATWQIEWVHRAMLAEGEK